MEKQEKYDMERLVDLAASGNRDALEELLGDVQDMVLTCPFVCWERFLMQRMHARRY